MIAALLVLVLAFPSFAGPDEVLVQVIRNAAPEGSPLLAETEVARAQLERTDRLSHATELVHFPPYRLVAVRYMDPAAGPPGVVLEDLRLLYYPALGQFAVASLAWVADYRRTRPIDVTKMSDEALTAYITELVSLVPRADRWGFVVSGLRREGRTVQFEVSMPHHPSGARAQPSTEQWVFTPSGAVESAPWLGRAFRVE